MENNYYNTIKIIVNAIIMTVLLSACEKTPSGTSQTDNRKNYLLESITCLDDSTIYSVTNYEYDDQCRLIRIVNGLDTSKEKTVTTLKYDGNLLTEVTEKYGDYQPEHIYFHYNNKSQITHMEYDVSYGSGITRYGYHDGRIDSVYGNNPEIYFLLKYDKRGNVVKIIARRASTNLVGTPTGEYFFDTMVFEYDNHPRPFLNLDGLPFLPIPGLGNFHESPARMFSTNNMTYDNLCHFEYTYDTNGLPLSVSSPYSGYIPYVYKYKKIR